MRLVSVTAFEGILLSDSLGSCQDCVLLQRLPDRLCEEDLLLSSGPLRPDPLFYSICDHLLCGALIPQATIHLP